MAYLPSFFNTVLLFCHIYLYLNLRRAFGQGWWRLLVIVLLSAGYLAIAFRSRILSHTDNRMVIHGILLWAGFAIISTMWTGARDLLHLFALLLDRLCGSSLARRMPAAASVRLALALGALAFAYSIHEAAAVGIRNVVITTDRLPPGTDRVRIAVLTDMHIVRHTPVAWVERMVELTNARNPDMVVLLGDIVDDRLEGRPDLAAAMRGLVAPHGRFAVLGNHEYSRGAERSTAFLEGAGFTVLRGDVRAAAGVELAGVDDPRFADRRGIAETLADATAGRFVILLAHRPETPPEARGMFDLQLSGHTHGGQIWPIALLNRLRYGYWSGLTRLAGERAENGRPGLLYISRGTGYYGPPIRFLAPPEITLVEVAPKECAKKPRIHENAGPDGQLGRKTGFEPATF